MPNAESFELIEQAGELEDFCRELESEPRIAFDTEFVSEDRYLPELCLLQVAVKGRNFLLDPIRIGNSLDRFWELLGKGERTTIVHAGREEFRFCKRFGGKRPVGLFDTQIAAGLMGLDYPAAYSTLVSKLTGKQLKKGETRSDWRRRPLSKSQLAYAASDVVYLEKLHRKMTDKLEASGRLGWLKEEMEFWQSRVELADSADEAWLRLSGLTGLDRRSLGIARRLWEWREQNAEARNSPPRKILRDDLLVELSRRASSSRQKIKSIRGMERRQHQKHLDEISKVIGESLEVPESSLPKKILNTRTPQLGSLGQFLNSALGVICGEHQIAPGIVCTTSELRELAAWKLEIADRPGNRLMEGWRQELMLPIIDGLLDGTIGLRVHNPRSSMPLEMVNLPDPTE